MTSAGTMIVGGGLAGSMAALELAQAGRRVTLLEKSRGPHDKVCGEFLSYESLLYLRRCGLDPLQLGAVPIYTVRFALWRGRIAEARLPFPACSLSRRTLDEALLAHASKRGVQVRRGAHVTSLQQESGKWTAHLRDRESMHADTAMIATGKHDLAGWPRPAGVQGDLVAFKMYYRLTEDQRRAIAGAVELALFPGGYAGLQAVEDDRANLCLLIQARQLRQSGGHWPGVLAHVLASSAHLAQRLHGATALLEHPLAASRIPYGHVQGEAQDGLWRLGDQAAVVPSFCGDGMAMALHSGALAAQSMLQGWSSMRFQRELHRQLAGRIALATRLSQLLVHAPHLAVVAQLLPSALPAIARFTRIPADALVAAGLPPHEVESMRAELHQAKVL